MLLNDPDIWVQCEWSEDISEAAASKSRLIAFHPPIAANSTATMEGALGQ